MANVCVAMSPAEVTEKLGLHRMRDRLWYVHPRFVPASFSRENRVNAIAVVLPPVRGSSKVFNGYPTLSAVNLRSRRCMPTSADARI